MPEWASRVRRDDLATRLPWALLPVAALVATAVAWHTLVSDFGVPSPAAGTLAAVQGLALAGAPRWPLPAWALSLAAAVAAAVVAGGTGGTLWPAPSLYLHLAVLFMSGLAARPWLLAAMWAGTFVAGVALRVTLPTVTSSPGLVEASALSAMLLVAAGALNARQRALDRLAEQQQRAEQDRLRAALLEERARIARELHDVVAHHMSLVAIQAEAGPYRTAAPPAELVAAFATIRANAVDALAELRHVLGLLRGDHGDDDSAPQPGLRDLDSLLANVREAGVTIEMSVRGSVRALPPSLQLSAYRIVQEALNNAVRHAPGAAVRVGLAYLPDALHVQVVNDPCRGAPPARAGPGHGVLGMRERAAMLGGRLTAGPMPNGGYAVTAVLPAMEADQT